MHKVARVYKLVLYRIATGRRSRARYRLARASRVTVGVGETAVIRPTGRTGKKEGSRAEDSTVACDERGKRVLGCAGTFREIRGGTRGAA